MGVSRAHAGNESARREQGEIASRSNRASRKMGRQADQPTKLVRVAHRVFERVGPAPVARKVNGLIVDRTGAR